MTTTVTVKTFGNPARISVMDYSDFREERPERRAWSNSSSGREEFQPANTERDYSVSGPNASISVSELSEGATGLTSLGANDARDSATALA